jgi:hypothetical protein
MLVTNQFRQRKKWREDLVIRVHGSTVRFQAYDTVADMLYHQKRRVMTNVNRSILHAFLRDNVGDRGAGQLIRELNENDPEWFSKLFKQSIEGKGWWVLPRPISQWTRLVRLKDYSWRTWWYRLPVAIFCECIDLYAALVANRDMRKGRYHNIWRRGR